MINQSELLDIQRVRADFPILAREVHPGVPLIYLDSTATSQKPEMVIQAMDRYYRQTNANIHRGIHVLAEESTAGYEAAREKVARVHQRPICPAGYFYAQCHRVDQPGGVFVGASIPVPRRCGIANRDGAPLQSGPLADPGG